MMDLPKDSLTRFQ
jgi:hypothetical protein